MSSLEKVEIVQDTLAILLGGEPPARPVVQDWSKSTFTPNRSVWAAYAGEYQTSHGPLRLFRDGDKLLGLVAGVNIEFVPLSATAFIILSDLSALDEIPVEFQRQPDGSFTLPFLVEMLVRKK